MTIRLTIRTPRHWRGNGFGYERCSYTLLRDGETLGVVLPSGDVGWTIAEADGTSGRRFFRYLADV